MTEQEAYQEHIRYTHDTYCRIVMSAAMTRTRPADRTLRFIINAIYLMICRTTAKEKKPSDSRHICAPILNRRLLKNSRPPVLFAYQSVSSSVWRP